MKLEKFKKIIESANNLGFTHIQNINLDDVNKLIDAGVINSNDEIHWRTLDKIEMGLSDKFELVNVVCEEIEKKIKRGIYKLNYYFEYPLMKTLVIDSNYNTSILQDY